MSEFDQQNTSDRSQVAPTALEEQAIRGLTTAYQRMRQEISKVVIGQDEVVDQLLIAMFCRGHCLLVGVPGLAKTLLCSTIASILQLSFRRIQFTPDLMPSDITGTDVLQDDPETGRRVFQFIQGPLFTNVLLADEINRTPPKTQAALLEAMQERHCTVGSHTYALPDPFFTLATQNPIEQEGTFPLPEAQLDRFMFKIVVPYPGRAELNEVVERTILRPRNDVPCILNSAELLRMRGALDKVVVADAIKDYAVRLVLSTHPESVLATERVRNFVRWGASPRAAQALIKAARVRALTASRAHIAFEDVRHFAAEVLQHRILLNYDGQADGVRVEELVRECVETLPEDTALMS